MSKISPRLSLITLFFICSYGFTDETLPQLYSQDISWLKSSMSLMATSLQKLKAPASIDSIANALETPLLTKLLPYIIQKAKVLRDIESRIQTEKSAITLEDLKFHRDVHRAQLSYLCDQLRTRYGFSELWNSSRDDQTNLEFLSNRFGYKRDANQNLIFSSSGLAQPTREVPGKSSDSFLKMKNALKKRIDFKEAALPLEERAESFRQKTISRAKLLPAFLFFKSSLSNFHF